MLWMITIERFFIPCKPFQKEVDFRTIPICLESENATDYQLLDKVANQFRIRYSQSTLNNEKPCM
jgi:hypothetical protein